MSLQKRSDAVEETTAPAAEPTHEESKQKPVYVYIIILFVAAAMLIVVSLLAHQRSNEQVIGELQTSVNALQNLQESQELNMQLKDQIEDYEEQIQDYEVQLSDAETEGETAAATIEALQWLGIIEQLYGAEEYTTCLETIDKFKASGTMNYLPTDNTLTETAVSPAQRLADIEYAISQMTGE